jgi:quercetin dioxygenase-like cupin family protein
MQTLSSIIQQLARIQKRYAQDISRKLRAGLTQENMRVQISIRKTQMEEAMKRRLYLGLAIAGLVCGASQLFTVAAQHNGSHPTNSFTPETVQYGPVPSFVPPGAQFAVLEGNPVADTGDYTVRLKMPDGYRIAPHWHPKRENVTVVSGTLKFGMGDHFDERRMVSYAAGSFAYLDPDMHHYVMASGETVVQIHGMSPVKFNYINTDDDPSRKR